MLIILISARCLHQRAITPIHKYSHKLSKIFHVKKYSVYNFTYFKSASCNYKYIILYGRSAYPYYLNAFQICRRKKIFNISLLKDINLSTRSRSLFVCRFFVCVLIHTFNFSSIIPYDKHIHTCIQQACIFFFFKSDPKMCGR